MATDLFEGAFNQILLKTAKNDHVRTLFQLCLSPSPTFLRQLDSVFNFPRFLIYQTWISKNLAGFASF